MTTWRKILLTAMLFCLQPVLADPIAGTVYGVYPEGVMVDYGGGSYLVPTQHATFQLGGLNATWSSLLPGQAINVIVPEPHWHNVVQIRDPYSWKLKHHPNHPH
ncbi:MAG: hypothetical protein WC423_06840, partial [Vulcanimicrobiota bacterium]